MTTSKAAPRRIVITLDCYDAVDTVEAPGLSPQIVAGALREYLARVDPLGEDDFEPTQAMLRYEALVASLSKERSADPEHGLSANDTNDHPGNDPAF